MVLRLLLRSQWPVRLALTCLAAAGLGGCSSPAERGYYSPCGQPLRRAIGSHREQARRVALEVRCQGVYVNEVEGDELRTVHLQLELVAVSSRDVVLERDRLVVDLHGLAPGGDDEPPAVRVSSLALAEAWAGKERQREDLVAPGFGRRAFDLFFDMPDTLGRPLPVAVLFRWGGASGEMPIVGQARFVRIPPGDPLEPAAEMVGDPSFGMRDGYYLPGHVDLGQRQLVPSEEQRLHYLFHRLRTWPWTWMPW